MPPKVLRNAAVVLVFMLVLALAPSAMAADPANTKQTVTSVDFNSSNGGFVFSPVDITYPSMAYWGRLSSARRGTSGYGMWCAGTERYPTPSISTRFPNYPKLTDLAPRNDEQITLGGVAQPLSYQGASSIEVWSGANKTGTKYVKDTHYTVGTNVAGFTTITRKGTVIPSGATIYVTYKFKTAGTSGKSTLSVPQLDNYYQSWLSFYYYMPSLGTNDQFTLNWVASDNPGGPKESIYGSALPVNSGWVYKERELSNGDTVKLSRRAGTLSFQFVDNTPGAGGVAGGQGPAIDDLKVVGYKYGPVPLSSIALGDGDGIPVAQVDYKSTYEDKATITLTGTDVGQKKLTWAAPPTSLTDSSPDTRDIAYRVWRKVNTGTWSELTSDSNRLSDRELQDAVTPGTYTYAVQAWDPSGSGQGAYTAKAFSIAAATATDGIAQIEYKINNGSLNTVNGASKQLTFNPNTSAYTIWFRVKDNADNWSAPRTITFRVNAKTAFSSLSGNQTPSYGKGAYVSGYLKAGSAAVVSKTVTLQRLSNRTSGTWVNVATKNTGSNGYVRFDIPATSSGYNYTKTTYRLAFNAVPGFVGTAASSRSIDPKAYLGKPWSSKKTVKAKKTYTWYSSIKPRHTSGSKVVKLEFQRYKSGKYRAYKTIYAKTYNYSSYSRVKASYKLPYKGKWRVRAVHDDAGHAKTYSSWLYKTAK